MHGRAHTADAVVIGAGLHGCATALHLTRAGLEAMVIEKDYVGRHASSVNAGGVRRLGRAFPEIPLADAGTRSTSTILADAPFGSGQRVLVIDDEVIMLKAVPDLLAAIGYEAAIASNCKEGIELYHSWKPDVVLLDRNMPEMDGRLCAAKLLARDPAARIVIISGYDQEGEDGLEPEFRQQVKGYLTKPVHIADLQVLLARLLKIKGPK